MDRQRRQQRRARAAATKLIRDGHFELAFMLCRLGYPVLQVMFEREDWLRCSTQTGAVYITGAYSQFPYTHVDLHDAHGRVRSTIRRVQWLRSIKAFCPKED